MDSSDSTRCIDSSGSSSEEQSDLDGVVELPQTPQTDLDESVIIPPRQGRRMRVESSSEEDDEPIILSPKTRRSMGIRPPIRSTASEESSDTDFLDESDDPDAGSVSEDEESSQSFADSAEGTNSPAEETSNSSLPRNNTTKEQTPSSFEKSVFKKVQSTPYVKKDDSTAPIEELSKRLTNIDITTDEILLISDDSEAASKQHVSPAVLNAERVKLEELLSAQQKTMDLYKKVGSNLPDKGAQLLKKSKSIEEEVELQMKRVSQLSVKYEEEEDGAACLEVLAEHNEFQEREAKITTQRGRNMLESKKKVTVETLHAIHQNLKERPAEDMLMEDPEGLLVPLLDHQKYALTFMTWRENNRPRGGILADDMGTGKTLTMISLMLQDKSQKKTGSDDESPAWRKKNSINLYNGGNLVVCPASLMQQWCSEVKTKCTKGTISGYQQHGSYRESKARRLAKFDLVITTYDTLSSEFRNHGAIFGINWHRVILDEGHIMRNHKTQMAKACFELVARNRWVLTGTPVQNTVKDIYSIVKFLDCEPFSDIEYWNLFIGDKNCKPEGVKRVNTILKLIMLRRTKVELQAKNILPALPLKEVKTVEVSLSTDENILYQKFLTYSKNIFMEYLAERNIPLDNDAVSKKMHRLYENIRSEAYSRGVSTMEIFTLILRLRQICCHPGLLHINSKDQEELNASSGGEGSGVSVNLVDVIERMDTVDGVRSLKKFNRSIYELTKPSSKIAAVVSAVMNVIENSDDKIVIVSQWTSLLSIIEMHLKEKHLDCLILTGMTKISNRAEIIQNFNNPHHATKILLLSLATGGVGLNLVGGNHLFMVDPHWNPQLEFQAHDRIYRMGQKKDVNILKFVTPATMEERVVMIQKKKIEVSETVLTGVNSIKSGLSLADLRKLFDM